MIVVYQMRFSYHTLLNLSAIWMYRRTDDRVYPITKLTTKPSPRQAMKMNYITVRSSDVPYKNDQNLLEANSARMCS